MGLAKQIIDQVNSRILGKEETVRLAVACFFAEGHLLIDDIPGVGKTTLALGLAQAVGGTFRRVQFTSDLLPSDILGVSIYDPDKKQFEFRKGPLFHNVILADEINRGSPKTQSALLEAMQEKQVSSDDGTRALPDPFFVMATQNPFDDHGTFPLPDSQLDRFLMRVRLGYPDAATEKQILKDDAAFRSGDVKPPVADHESIHQSILKVRTFRVDDSIDDYLVRLGQATRESEFFSMGLSPRGVLALRRAAQGYAATMDRDFVVPDDVKAVAPSVIGHRVHFKNASASDNPAQMDLAIEALLSRVAVPR